MFPYNELAKWLVPILAACLGGVVVALLNREKTKAEIQKLRADTEKAKEETDTLRREKETIRNDINKQQERIDALLFLVANLLTRPELEHLTKIKERREFIVDSFDGLFRDRFRDEIARLLNLGFITLHNDKNNRDLFEPGEPRYRDILEYCDVDSTGERYLKLREEVQRASAAG